MKGNEKIIEHPNGRLAKELESNPFSPSSAGKSYTVRRNSVASHPRLCR